MKTDHTEAEMEQARRELVRFMGKMFRQIEVYPFLSPPLQRRVARWLGFSHEQIMQINHEWNEIDANNQ